MTYATTPADNLCKFDPSLKTPPKLEDAYTKGTWYTPATIGKGMHISSKIFLTIALPVRKVRVRPMAKQSF